MALTHTKKWLTKYGRWVTTIEKVALFMAVKADIKEAQERSDNSGYTQCPKFRCNWKCRIGYLCKCGGTACRVERHSV